MCTPLGPVLLYILFPFLRVGVPVWRLLHSHALAKSKHICIIIYICLIAAAREKDEVESEAG